MAGATNSRTRPTDRWAFDLAFRWGDLLALVLAFDAFYLLAWATGSWP